MYEKSQSLIALRWREPFFIIKYYLLWKCIIKVCKKGPLLVSRRFSTLKRV